MAPDHFLKFRCRKMARRCGAKHIWQVKMLKRWGVWTTFWSSDVEKLYAAVARSTCASQNARQTHGTRPLFEVQMSKNGTPLWREAHFASQNVKKKWGAWTTLWSSDVEKLHAAVARSTFASQNVKSVRCSDHKRSSDVEKWHAAVPPSAFTSQNVQSTGVLAHFSSFGCGKGVRQKR